MDKLRLVKEKKAMLISTIIILVVIALGGLAFDASLVYLERRHLNRTVDSAALAAVLELPNEQYAIERAIEYIRLNGYKVGQLDGDTEILIRGCVDPDRTAPWDVLNMSEANLDPIPKTDEITGAVYIPTVVQPARATFLIDTGSFQTLENNSDNCNTSSNVLGTANKIQVRGSVNVRMYFAHYLGWHPTISEQVIGENVTNLDMVFVFDVTGSMEPEAKSGVKKTIQLLDPKFDQVAFVPSEGNGGESHSKLQCLEWAIRYAGGRSHCFSGPNPITFTHVLKAIDTYQSATENHHIATGLKEGLAEFGIGIGDSKNTVDSQCTDGVNHPDQNGDGHACDRRGGARRVLFLLTDGTANDNPGQCVPGEGRPDLWNGLPDPDNDDYECAMYYAWQAAQNNVPIYAIGLGEKIDLSLLQAITSGADDSEFYFQSRGGRAFAVSSREELFRVFEQILSNPGPRIVGMIP